MDSNKRLSKLNEVTLTHVWLALPVLVLLTIVWGWGDIAPNDFWWHIRTGQIILETRHIPRTDLYSFTHFGEPWTYQAWLMQIALYLIYRIGGPPFTLFIHALVIVSGYLLLQISLLRLTHNNARLAAIITICAAVISLENWGVRPQTISFPLFSLTLFIILRYRQRQGNVLWWLPLIFLVWVNAHGGFIFGLVLLGCFALDQLWKAYRAGDPMPIRPVLLPTALTVAALGVNPVGPIGIVQYVLGFARHPITRKLNTEFQPLTITTTTGILFTAIVILLIVALIRRGYRPDVFESLALLLFGLLALRAIRNPPWFGFAAAPVAAVALTQGKPASPPRPGRGKMNALLLAILILFTIISLPWFRSFFPAWNERRSILRKYTPIEATAYICERLPSDARVFSELSYSSYLIWGCPRLRVFVDTRIELYSEQEWLDYISISAARYTWQRLLDQYQITHLLAHRKEQPHLIAAAEESPCWQVIYQDDVSVVFARTTQDACPE